MVHLYRLIEQSLRGKKMADCFQRGVSLHNSGLLKMIHRCSVSISNNENKRNLPNHRLRQIAVGTVAAAQRDPFNKSMRPGAHSLHCR